MRLGRRGLCCRSLRRGLKQAHQPWLNFSLADVRGGTGPYLGIFLLTTQNWTPATIWRLTFLSVIKAENERVSGHAATEVCHVVQMAEARRAGR
jgi:hypothetical protein